MENIRERAAKCVRLRYRTETSDVVSHYVDDNGNLYPDFDPEHNPRHSGMLEAEVGRRKLPDLYIHHLSGIVGITPDMQAWMVRWRYATATPAQRTEAAVLTLESSERKES